MKKEKRDSGCSGYQIKFTINVIEPPIWRSVQIPGRYTLGDLHYVIQAIMDWEDAHLHEFAVGKQSYGPSGEVNDQDVFDESEVTLAMLLGSTRKKFTYHYDFGDDWCVIAEVEKRLKLDEELERPVCLAGARRGPCEDSGGPWGYLSNLEALQDPEHPDYADIVEWMGDDWDPEYFNLDEINQRLAMDPQDMVDDGDWEEDDLDEDEQDAFIEQMLNEDPFLEERVMRLHNKIAQAYGIEPGDSMHSFVEKMSADDLKHFAETHLAGDRLEAAHEFGLLALTADDFDEKMEFARKALELDPQNVDGRIVMANDMMLSDNVDGGIAMVREAMSVAEATLGQKFFLQHRGKLGERVEARPYLRTLLSLA
ncbi:MAG: plasmid pRiA4b ORF-3 family protein, partial [Candidatus Hydrogenedentes bacterium]|nr:plasmid pRiA4b ORF-3 family protein [Candidatus Hydrogenedentota bacterium]